MSWSDQMMRCLRRLSVGFALLPALFLAGCLHPLYGTTGEGGRVAEQLKTIQVMPTSARLGHYLDDELIFAFNGTGSQVTPKYKLVVVAAEGVSTPLVDTVTGLVTAATVQTTATYTLTSNDTGKVVAQGRVFTTATYDRTSQRFSDMRAARDAEQRDARVLADQIRTEIAAVFATGT
ncbi:MAG: LPS assembly lipoprotein LptE [Methylovirgula sp.]